MMSYFIDPTRALTAENTSLHIRLAALVLGVVFAMPAVAVNKHGPVLQHEDHSERPTIPKGTNNSVCQSGVSSGFPCKNVELLARLPLAEIGGGQGADSWGWKDTETGRYYAIFARSNGTSFVDVSEPEAPVYLGNLPSTSGNRPWRDVKVYANHAFIVADDITNHGMQVFDLTRLRGLESPRQFSTDALYNGIGFAHNVAINEASGFAYLAGGDDCDGGLHIVDIRNPKSPSFAGCFSADGYSHDVQCLTYSGPDSDHQGDEICFASNEDSLTIVDVSNKDAPVMLGKADYPQTAYSHQGWLDEEQGTFFMGDETDEINFGMNTRTLMFDVRDLDNPVYAGAHQHSTSVIDHNLYVKGDHVYQANYLGGLRILRIDRGQSTGLTEVAYFDTEPDQDALEFAGAWNVYPFFDNDTILVSDINNGLFVLRASLDDGSAETSLINGRLSGSWVSEGLNDQGIILNVGENDAGPYIFFAWFLYLDGQPFWLTGNTAFEYGVGEVIIPTQRLSGLEFAMPGSEKARRDDIGSIRIHVHGCNEFHVEYDFAGLGNNDKLLFKRLTSVQGRECDL